MVLQLKTDDDDDDTRIKKSYAYTFSRVETMSIMIVVAEKVSHNSKTPVPELSNCWNPFPTLLHVVVPYHMVKRTHLPPELPNYGNHFQLQRGSQEVG